MHVSADADTNCNPGNCDRNPGTRASNRHRDANANETPSNADSDTDAHAHADRSIRDDQDQPCLEAPGRRQNLFDVVRERRPATVLVHADQTTSVRRWTLMDNFQKCVRIVIDQFEGGDKTSPEVKQLAADLKSGEGKVQARDVKPTDELVIAPVPPDPEP